MLSAKERIGFCLRISASSGLISEALTINSASALLIFFSIFLIVWETSFLLTFSASSIEINSSVAPVLAIRLQRISGKYLADKRLWYLTSI